MGDVVFYIYLPHWSVTSIGQLLVRQDTFLKRTCAYSWLLALNHMHRVTQGTTLNIVRGPEQVIDAVELARHPHTQEHRLISVSKEELESLMAREAERARQAFPGLVTEFASGCELREGDAERVPVATERI